MHGRSWRARALVAVGTLALAGVTVAVGAAPSSAAPTSASPVTPATAVPHVVPRPTARQCPAPRRADEASCLALHVTDTRGMTPDATGLPAGYGPTTLKSAYKLPTALGAGQTVAVVDAYDDPNALADLTAYRRTFGLPALTDGQFRKVDQAGATAPLPTPDAGWAGEIALDLDMVSATCPRCSILLVEADSNSYADLAAAVDRAVAMGARYVSNSYGGPETGSASFAPHYAHPGVAITASSGDSGYGVQFPASVPQVTAVGGTSLSRYSGLQRGWYETAWSWSAARSWGTGSGCSSVYAAPSFQVGVTTACSGRSEADVAAVGDPATGVAVYNTYAATGWAVYGGTSASAPIIAGVYALGGNPGATPTVDPYAHLSRLFDVTSGTNALDATCSGTVQCVSTDGYDGPTGLGTPNGTGAFVDGTLPTACSGAVVTNPGFEQREQAWAVSVGAVTGSAPAGVHAGSWALDLFDYAYAAQTVRIPTGCHATLSFYGSVTTTRTDTTAVDGLTVYANDAPLRSWSNLTTTTGWVRRTVDLTPLAGQTVALLFFTDNTGGATHFGVDDVRITLR